MSAMGIWTKQKHSVFWILPEERNYYLVSCNSIYSYNFIFNVGKCLNSIV